MNTNETPKKHPNKHVTSLFLSLEGIEGSGKSTQIKEIKSYFEKLNYRVICLREPGGTELGEKIRELILTSTTKITETSELLLFAASRAHLLNTVIIPELSKEKTVVILDRYFDSTIAYQGMARGLGVEAVINTHKLSPLDFMPDLTFYLEIDLKTSFARQDKRGQEKDYFEKETENFYKKLIEGYEKAASLFPQRIQKIDATKSASIVTKEIETILNKKLGTKS